MSQKIKSVAHRLAPFNHAFLRQKRAPDVQRTNRPGLRIGISLPPAPWALCPGMLRRRRRETLGKANDFIIIFRVIICQLGFELLRNYGNIWEHHMIWLCFLPDKSWDHGWWCFFLGGYHSPWWNPPLRWGSHWKSKFGYCILPGAAAWSHLGGVEDDESWRCDPIAGG